MHWQDIADITAAIPTGMILKWNSYTFIQEDNGISRSAKMDAEDESARHTFCLKLKRIYQYTIPAFSWSAGSSGKKTYLTTSLGTMAH